MIQRGKMSVKSGPTISRSQCKKTKNQQKMSTTSSVTLSLSKTGPVDDTVLATGRKNRIKTY